MYKRKLLAMSALTGALALAGSGALADGKPVRIKLLLSGKFEVLGGYAAQRQSFEKSSDADVDGTTHYGALNILSSSEIHVTGSTRLENGLTVSVVVEFEGDQFTHNGTGSDNAIDKSYLAVAGSFGQIRIGSTNAGSHDLVNTAPNVGALSHDGGDTDDWILQPGNSAVGGPDTDIGAGDITRIAYVSQEIGGFTLGASYQPTAATTETIRPSAAIPAPTPRPTISALPMRACLAKPRSAPMFSIIGCRAARRLVSNPGAAPCTR